MADDNLIDSLLDRMTLAEQVSLLAGIDFWHTVPNERLGIPSMRVSDGPAGARGTQFDNGPVSTNIPCSTSLAATWDPELVEEIGHLLGRETRAKGARVLLAPTVNLHRTPVGGRNFECMSEDPHLTARTAVAYVRGLQAEGVASCIKHYIGNDTEFERNSIDSQIDDKTLREMYMVPFEAAVKEAGVLSIMTSYNRINGPFAADSRELIDGVLRGEWGFDGCVVSDWFGLHSTVEGIEAGLDLEMPGPTQHRGQKLVDAVERGDVEPSLVRAAARNVLTLMQRVGAFADGGPGEEGPTPDRADDRALVRRAAAAGMVLLRNAPGADGAPVLPLRLDAVPRVAVIGPNAAEGRPLGGGSAQVRPPHVSHPLAALQDRLGGVKVEYAEGCNINRNLPPIRSRLRDPFTLSWFTGVDDADDPAAVAAHTSESVTSRLMWTDDPDEVKATGDKVRSVRLRTAFRPDVSGAWQLGVTSVGPARVFVDGELVLDNSAVKPGGSFFGMGREETVASVELEAGRTYELEARLRRGETDQTMGGIHLNAQAPVVGDPVDDAVELAGRSDLAILVVGTNHDWESEGWDRSDLGLPGRQDELVARVAEACPYTVVVVNAGSPVTMPWLDDVNAVLYAWFPGQEMGDAIADVLLGVVEPEGRLPVTFPRRMEDTPASEHHPGRNGVAPYLERRLMGYRWYDTIGREPLFPFGFGLGYAPCSIVGATLVDEHHVQVEVRNESSDRDGVEVVQVYAHRVDREGLPADEPDQVLVGYAKVPVPAGATVTAHVHLDARAYSSWSVEQRAWVEHPGSFELRVGRSSRDVAARLARR